LQSGIYHVKMVAEGETASFDKVIRIVIIR